MNRQLLTLQVGHQNELADIFEVLSPNDQARVVEAVRILESEYSFMPESDRPMLLQTTLTSS